MTKNNNTSLLSIDFTEITRAQKTKVEYTSIAKYLFARCRTRINTQVLKIDFYKSTKFTELPRLF